MSTQERELHELYLGLEEVLGPDRAATLMSRLAAVPWVEVATKADLASLETRMTTRMEAQGDRLRAEMANQFTKQTWTMVFAFVMSLSSYAGLILALG